MTFKVKSLGTKVGKTSRALFHGEFRLYCFSRGLVRKTGTNLGIANGGYLSRGLDHKDFGKSKSPNGEFQMLQRLEDGNSEIMKGWRTPKW